MSGKTCFLSDIIYHNFKIIICIVILGRHSIITQPVMAKKNKPFSTAKAEALQKALEETELKIKALNTLIDVAEEQLKIDIRKKSGARQS